MFGQKTKHTHNYSNRAGMRVKCLVKMYAHKKEIEMETVNKVLNRPGVHSDGL